MKIKSIRVYQSVAFDKKQDTFFTTAKIPNRKSVNLKYNKEINGIEIFNTNDHVIVPVTNISSIHLWTESAELEQEQKEVARKSVKSKIRASEIKKPI